MTPAKHATFAVPGVMNTIFHASDTGVTTELQFDNAIQVEWFDKTLKQTCTQYPAIRTNYSLSNCTISNKKDFNRSIDFLVIN